MARCYCKNTDALVGWIGKLIGYAVDFEPTNAVTVVFKTVEAICTTLIIDSTNAIEAIGNVIWVIVVRKAFSLIIAMRLIQAMKSIKATLSLGAIMIVIITIIPRQAEKVIKLITANHAPALFQKISAAVIKLCAICITLALIVPRIE